MDPRHKLWNQGHQKLQRALSANNSQKVIELFLNQHAMVQPEAIEILNYRSKRTIAGLLLMPPTRHNFLPLGEAQRIKTKLQRVK